MPSKRPTPIDTEDDEDEAPIRPQPRQRADNGDDGGGEYIPGASDLLKPGFAAAKREMQASSTFANRFRAENSRTQIIKFLEDEPYVSYRQHWVTRQTQQGKTTRTYPCLQSIRQPCPLCKAGSKSPFVACYNIALLEGDSVEHKSWDCGVRLTTTLNDLGNDPKIGPLTRNYFRVSKSGEGTSTSYNVSSLKPRDLEEDEGIAEPDPAELKAFTLYTKDIVKFYSPKVMEELAEEIVDEY